MLVRGPLCDRKAPTMVHTHPPCCVAGIQREEEKVKKSVKESAKRGDTGTAKMLAKEIVRSRKATNRLHTSKAQMNSVVMQMENQLGEQHTRAFGLPTFELIPACCVCMHSTAKGDWSHAEEL